MLPTSPQARCYSVCRHRYQVSTRIARPPPPLLVDFERGLLVRTSETWRRSIAVGRRFILQRETVDESRSRSQRRHGPATSQLGHCCLQAPLSGSANQHSSNPRCQLGLLPMHCMSHRTRRRSGHRKPEMHNDDTRPAHLPELCSYSLHKQGRLFRGRIRPCKTRRRAACAPLCR